MAQEDADLVLEVAAAIGLQDTLIHNGETEHMTIGRRTVACQRGDTLQGAGLGMYISFGYGTSHAFREGAVLSGNGQRGM